MKAERLDGCGIVVVQVNVPNVRDRGGIAKALHKERLLWSRHRDAPEEGLPASLRSRDKLLVSCRHSNPHPEASG